MPKRAFIMVGGIAAAGMAVGPQARTQDPRGEQEVSASATREVGTQLVAGVTVQGPFTPTAPDHLWLDSGDATWMFLHFDKPLKEASKIIYTGWARLVRVPLTCLIMVLTLGY